MTERPRTKSPWRRFLSWGKRTALRMLLAVLRWRVEVEHRFGICAVFKNEARHLDEWLSFHSLMGVDHFVLYNDDSSDDFLAVLQPWIDRGHVTLRSAKKRDQRAIYNHFLRHGAGRFRWVAFIDLDEFLFSPLRTTLPDTMERYASVPAVFVRWILFGSNGHVQPPSGGTLDSYTKSIGIAGSIHDAFDHGQGGPRSQYVTGWARDGKCIINPRAVIEMEIHQPRTPAWGTIVDEAFGTATGKLPLGTEFTCDVLRINHYWSRSIEDLTTKVLKGMVNWKSRDSTNLERSLLRETLLNQVDDRIILHVRDALSAAGRTSTSE